MYFVLNKRINPATGEMDHYYRIKESFCDAEGRVHTRLMLAAGFLSELTTDEICTSAVDFPTCLNKVVNCRDSNISLI